MKKTKKSSAELPVFVSIAANKGKVRTANEDNFYADILGIREVENLCGHRVLRHSDRYVFGVCDGMGGEQFGDIASELAVLAMKDFSEEIRNSSVEKLHAAVNEYSCEANRKICRMTEERQAELSGSTFVMACVRGDLAYTFSIGDSRIYYIDENGIRQVSEDQTLAMKKLKANIYTEEEAKMSSDAHKITMFLGVDSRNIGLKALAYEPLDISRGQLLLCSDGLTDMCTDEEIHMVMTKYNDDFAAQHLVELALVRGGIDNITCMIIRRI